MKKSVAGIIVTAAIVASSIISSCGAPAGQPGAAGIPSSAPEELTTSYLAVPATAGERLQEMQGATQMLINQYLVIGQDAPDYVHMQTQALEKTRRDLAELDGQLAAINMLVAQQVAVGEQAPNCEYELAKSIGQAREDLLRRVGLEN